jgi:hypothetical protein
VTAWGFRPQPPPAASPCRGKLASRAPGEDSRMLIALLAVLGVDLIVIVVLLAAVLTRRRWVSHQSGAFKGAIRVVQGDAQGLGRKWRRGYGRRVGQVLVWTKAPFLFRNELVVAEAPGARLARLSRGR